MKLTKKERKFKKIAKELGWTYNAVEDEYLIKRHNASWEFVLSVDFDFDDVDGEGPVIDIIVDIRGVMSTPYFFGRLISKNHKKELKRIMKQLGVTTYTPPPPPTAS